MAIPEIERLVRLFARLPGLGSRSAQRAVLHLLSHKDAALEPLVEALSHAAAEVQRCSRCRTLDIGSPCSICRDSERDATLLCIVQDVADLWAMERSGAFNGRYHVLGGTLSALDRRGPDELGLPLLQARIAADGVEEVVLALGATVDGQTTAHYIADLLAPTGIRLTRLAHGVPVGGELHFLDDGTLMAALKSRRPA